MKKTLMVFWLATLVWSANAQTANVQATNAQAADAPAAADTAGKRLELIEAQRTRLNAEQSRLESEFAAEDAACYQKFAVNFCLDQINDRRKKAMAGIKQQELLLNDEERQIRGREQLRKIEEKSSPEKIQAQADKRAEALADHQSRLERAKNKAQKRAAAPVQEKASSAAHAEKLKNKQEKAQARSDQQTLAAENARRFNERQKAAQERRVQHEKEQKARTEPPAPSLPVPP